MSFSSRGMKRRTKRQVAPIHVRVRIDENSNDICPPFRTCSPKRSGGLKFSFWDRIYVRAGSEERDDLCFISISSCHVQGKLLHRMP